LNTFSHIIISRIVNRYIKLWYGIQIDKFSFIYGNIIPDYKSDFTKTPHYKKSMPNFIQNEVLALSNIDIKNTADFDKNLSFRLGIICHYLADFFCYAHSPKFTGSVFRHIEYEFMLGKYNSKKKKILRKIDFLNLEDIIMSPNKLIDKLEEMCQEYEECNHSFGMDITYTVQACVQLVVSVLYILRQKDQLYRFQEEKVIFDLSNRA
jgi:hypothetical protein